MKKLFTLLFVLGSICIVNAQTAVNFTCNDCDGNSHDLFTELDNGKVIVLCWAMPCASCIAPSKTTYNVVQSYQATNPDRVYFYLVDDYANTVCSSLNSWANTNAMPASSSSIRFSESSIRMTDYGTAGMPKIVVLGCNTHHVFYNVNGVVNATNLQAAIDDALVCETSTDEIDGSHSNVSIYPSPANDFLNIAYASQSEIVIEIYSVSGVLVQSFTNNETYSKTENTITIGTGDFENGLYLVKVNIDGKSIVEKINIQH
ncbi:MAG: hypothetical protein A2W91_06200 [Bacteroidetes bacterium GWF2_38_335]|nr:MAG: hypothetical protein A2W91_06200 [Bacteroidetes bacterium GWF2_38_335]OFY79660.1 MAG: hypothetical protein A2281_09480 [Bacteroidetes bacterium RIFOXYA12_FULL_38_20]HBS89018.1 hypothetical protein [Bacteroidales bacterium]